MPSTNFLVSKSVPFGRRMDLNNNILQPHLSKPQYAPLRLLGAWAIVGSVVASAFKYPEKLSKHICYFHKDDKPHYNKNDLAAHAAFLIGWRPNLRMRKSRPLDLPLAVRAMKTKLPSTRTVLTAFGSELSSSGN
jgi:hypothetical protein